MENDQYVNKLSLSGDFSIEGVNERHQELLPTVRRISIDVITCDNPSELSLDIDYSGVEKLDVCGCQLIALFLQQIRRTGLIKIRTSGTEDVQNNIRAFGFGSEILTGEM